MNNNNFEDIDEYEYVTYADKYFGEQQDNESIHTQPIIIPEFTELDIFQKLFEEYNSKLTKLAREISERQKQINKLKEIRNQFNNNLTKLQTQMRNLSNNNNNNNVNLNIMKQIKNIQKHIDNLTNNIEELKDEQIASERIYRKALIEDREKFIEAQKNSYFSIIK
jgi:chromosome segregation ATPase